MKGITQTDMDNDLDFDDSVEATLAQDDIPTDSVPQGNLDAEPAETKKVFKK